MRKLKPREIRECLLVTCRNTFEVKIVDTQKYCCVGCANLAKKDVLKKPREIRICITKGCEKTFEVIITSSRRYCQAGCWIRGKTCMEYRINKRNM